MKNRKSIFGFSYISMKYGKFWSLLPGHFIKHKHLISEEWIILLKFQPPKSSVSKVEKKIFFQVCGVENLATADPLNVLDLKDGQYHSEFSYVCRFSLGVAIYISIALGQIIIWCGFYNHLIEDKLEQFTDVCSLANISMFAMAQNNFGYYIHGK